MAHMGGLAFTGDMDGLQEAWDSGAHTEVIGPFHDIGVALLAPLSMALSGKNMHVFDWLLEHGAAADPTSTGAVAALRQSIDEHNEPAALRLMDVGVRLETSGPELPLLKACKAHCAEVVRRLVQEGAPYQHPDHRPCFMHSLGSTQLMQFWLGRSGAEYVPTDAWLGTPVMNFDWLIIAEPGDVARRDRQAVAAYNMLLLHAHRHPAVVRTAARLGVPVQLEAALADSTAHTWAVAAETPELDYSDMRTAHAGTARFFRAHHLFSFMFRPMSQCPLLACDNTVRRLMLKPPPGQDAESLAADPVVQAVCRAMAVSAPADRTLNKRVKAIAAQAGWELRRALVLHRRQSRHPNEVIKVRGRRGTKRPAAPRGAAGGRAARRRR